MTQQKEDDAPRKPAMKRRESAPERPGKGMDFSGLFRYPPTRYGHTRTSNPVPGRRGSK